MKNNIIKTIILLTFIFISSCGSCGFSERCYREEEEKRIFNITKEERDHEKQDCIKEYERMISITKHEKKKCDFWSCVDGKEDWKRRLENCLWRLDNLQKRN
jgi:hypothetical protein